MIVTPWIPDVRVRTLTVEKAFSWNCGVVDGIIL